MTSPSNYKSRLKVGSLRQTTKKMMVSKISGSAVGDTKLKKFLKEDKGLRRMAYGDQNTTVESWKGRKFLKQAKSDIEASGEVRASYYGKKSSAEKAFRDTVKEEIHQDQAAKPKGPSKDELDRQKRLQDARGHLRQYEQAREIEKEQGDPLGRNAVGKDRNAPAAGNERQASGTPRSVQIAGGAGRTADARSEDQRTSVAVAGSGSAGSAEARAGYELPEAFGLRGRVLRVDSIKQEMLVRVLNAPSELAIFIGRDKTVQVPKSARCWKERHPIACSEVRVADLVDARGKVLNGQFAADEVHVNGGELPDFVQHLGRSEPSIDLPSTPPDELAIG